MKISTIKIQIKVLFFAKIREFTKKSEEIINSYLYFNDLNEKYICLSDVINQSLIFENNLFKEEVFSLLKSCLIAVNDEYVNVTNHYKLDNSNGNFILYDENLYGKSTDLIELSIIPPISSG